MIASKLKKHFGLTVFIIVISMFIIPLFINGRLQGDFETIYAGATAYRLGLNPYDTTNLSIAFREHIQHPYVYTPLTLVAFQPLTLLSYQFASTLFITLKLISLAFLIFIWFKIFPFENHRNTFFIISLFAFGGAIIADVRAGNISIFEQLIIWAGFFFFMKKKTLYFVGAIIIASIFKMAPILLLGLLPITFRKKESGYAVLGIGIFLLVICCNLLFSSALFSSFLSNSTGLFTTTSLGERGKLNPSTLSFIQDIFGVFKAQITFSDLIPKAMFIVIGSIAIGFSIRAFRKLSYLENEDASLWQICVMCLLYAVIIPRFKDYSYILLIAPAFYSILHTSKKLFIPLALFFLFFLTYRNYGILSDQLFHLMDEYYSLLAAWVMLGMCYYTVMKLPSKRTLQIEETFEHLN